jgi:hypothetical protein
VGDIGRIGLFPRGGVVGKQFHRFPTFARPMGRWFKGGSTRCSLEHSREHIRSEAESKPFRSDGVPSRRPDLSRARRIALRAYKFTSKELRRRSDDDIAEDTVLTRPLRIGGFAVWCFWGFAACCTFLLTGLFIGPAPLILVAAVFIGGMLALLQKLFMDLGVRDGRPIPRCFTEVEVEGRVVHR